MEMNLKETIPAEELKKRQMDLPHLTERMKQQSDDAVLMVQKNTNIENPQLFNIFPARNIKTVIFKDTLADAPNTASDLSEKQNRSVLGWMENDTLYLAGNGGVKANQDSSHLFNFCTELERIEFNYCFDTSNVTNMHSMFYYCSSLTFLDVSGFDTSNVTNMNAMFYYCSSLTSLDVSGFNTSNAANKKYMFDKCPNQKALESSMKS